MQSEPLQSFEVRLTIPDAKLSINGRARIHWATLDRLKHVVFRDVGRALVDQLPELFEMQVVEIVVDRRTGRKGVEEQARSRGLHFSRAEIIATFTFPTKRSRDLDNLYGRIKPCIDTIVRTGVLVDDDVEHLELRIRCHTQKGVEHLDIHVEEQPADWQEAMFTR